MPKPKERRINRSPAGILEEVKNGGRNHGNGFYKKRQFLHRSRLRAPTGGSRGARRRIHTRGGRLSRLGENPDHLLRGGAEHRTPDGALLYPASACRRRRRGPPGECDGGAVRCAPRSVRRIAQLSDPLSRYRTRQRRTDPRLRRRPRRRAGTRHHAPRRL